MGRFVIEANNNPTVVYLIDKTDPVVNAENRVLRAQEPGAHRFPLRFWQADDFGFEAHGGPSTKPATLRITQEQFLRQVEGE